MPMCPLYAFLFKASMEWYVVRCGGLPRSLRSSGVTSLSRHVIWLIRQIWPYHLDTEMSSGDIVDSFSSDSSRVSKFSTSRNMLKALYLSNRPSHKLDSWSRANSQFAHLKPDKHHFLRLLVHKSSLNQHQSFHHSQICSSFARMFAVEFNTSPF